MGLPRSTDPAGGPSQPGFPITTYVVPTPASRPDESISREQPNAPCRFEPLGEPCAPRECRDRHPVASESAVKRISG